MAAWRHSWDQLGAHCVTLGGLLGHLCPIMAHNAALECQRCPLYCGQGWSRVVDVGECKRFAAGAGPAELKLMELAPSV